MRLTIINEVRTNNSKDEFSKQTIAKLWKAASTRLTNQEAIVYGVYHEYKNDYKGDYTLSIATEDDTGEPSIELPDNTKYEIFPVDTTNEQSIINTWKCIWKREDAGTLQRAYAYDFEKYHPNGEVEIYIAIR